MKNGVLKMYWIDLIITHENLIDSKSFLTNILVMKTNYKKIRSRKNKRKNIKKKSKITGGSIKYLNNTVIKQKKPIIFNYKKNEKDFPLLNVNAPSLSYLLRKQRELLELTVKPLGGLGNCLRVVFSYYEYAKSINYKLNVLWTKTDQCPGYFLDYFEPIPNINFISKMPKNAKIYYSGFSNHPIMYPNYRYLKLLPYVKDIITRRIDILKNNYIAIHIRRTDHIESAKKSNSYTTDEEFIQFIDKFDGKKNLYIATDNKETYDKFKTKYPKLVKFEYHETTDNLRKTTLLDAIIDVYICVYSEHFMRSGWSSFSTLIEGIRKHLLY